MSEIVEQPVVAPVVQPAVQPAVQPEPESGAAPKPAAAPAEKSKPDVEAEPEVTVADTEPVELAIPSFLPLKEQTPEREAWVQEFAALAPQVGLDGGAAQQILEAVVDVATAVPYQAVAETEDDAVQAMEQAYGTEAAKDLIVRAQRYTKRLGPAAQDYLNRTGLGNDLATLTTLALAETGIFKLTSAQAAEAITKIMADKAYTSPDKRERLLQVAKIQILSRIAHGDARRDVRQDASQDASQDEAQPDAPRPEAGHQAYLEWKSRNTKEQIAAKEQEAKGGNGNEGSRKEAADMVADKDGALMNAGHPGHAAAVKRWHELVAKL